MSSKSSPKRLLLIYSLWLQNFLIRLYLAMGNSIWLMGRQNVVVSILSYKLGGFVDGRPHLWPLGPTYAPLTIERSGPNTERTSYRTDVSSRSPPQCLDVFFDTLQPRRGRACRSHDVLVTLSSFTWSLVTTTILNGTYYHR
jgi:hypothetical protein